MAGESPDRAEQQGSSEGRTTASSSAVPPSAPPASPVSTATPEPSSSSERVDRATAVFRTLAPRTPEDDAPAAEESASGPEGGDRLKQAVAAWVATTDGPSTGPDADTAGDGAGADGEAGTEREAGAGSEPASESGAASGAKSGTGAARESEPKPASGAKAESEQAPESGSDAGPSEEPASAEGPAGAARAAESAVEARTAAGDAEEPAEGAATATEGAGRAAEAAVAAAGDAEGAEKPAEATGAAAETTEKVPAAAEEAREAPARAGADAGPSEEPSGAGKAAGTPAASWFAPKKAEGGAKAEPKAAAPVDPRTGARPEPEATGTKPDTTTGAKSEPATEAKPDTTAGAKPGAVAGAKPGAAGAGGADESPVDQPTTMFRAVRPPVVDQPTTALKLPRTPGTDPDAERTSTFVPLRPDLPGAGASEPEAKKAVGPATGPKAEKTAPAATPATPADPALAEPERTRQQPLPPLPPLDLLAELTNTPPPPPSPWRTVLRRVRIWTPLVLILLIVFAIAQMVRPLPQPALALSAAPSFTFEGGELAMPWPTEGQGAVEVEGVGSMGTYGAQKPAPIASVTKTMTAYVILRDHPIKGKQQGPEITVDAKAAEQANAQHESTAAVREGQKYTQKELLQLLMIPSANNVARLLARWDAGSEQAFVDKMNAAAKDLGMTQSRYTDPSGLLDSTVSTPQDQLKLAKAVMQYDVFREIVNMPNVTVDGIPGRIENNNNILLKPGVSGIKTGSSTPAGGNLLWSANTVVDGENRRILGIVMGAKNAKVLNDKLQLSIDYSYELIKQAQKDVTSAVVVRKGQVVGYVDDGLGGRTPVVATKELKPVGWPGLKVKLELTDGGKTLPHTGRAGDVVGTVSVGEGAGRVSAPVALQADLAEPGFDKKLTRIS